MKKSTFLVNEQSQLWHLTQEYVIGRHGILIDHTKKDEHNTKGKERSIKKGEKGEETKRQKQEKISSTITMHTVNETPKKVFFCPYHEDEPPTRVK